MKKALIMCIVVVLCISLCSCSETITKEELIGNWNFESTSASVTLHFNDQGRVGYVYIELEPGSKSDYYNISDSETCGGTYEIDGDKINISFEEYTHFGKSCTVNYANGKLEIGGYSLTKSN